jgi:hypothetical protein
MKRLSIVAAMLTAGLTLLPARAQAITLQEIIELTKAGLGEEVLLALIEIDPRVYPVDPETLTKLKAAGVKEKVIVAIVRSGRTPLPMPAPVAAVEPDPVPVNAPDPAPPVVVVEREPVTREVAVPIPVYIPVQTHGWQHHDGRQHHDGPHPSGGHGVEHRRKPAEPVYWGWGGKLRPDAWKPSPTDHRKR